MKKFVISFIVCAVIIFGIVEFYRGNEDIQNDNNNELDINAMSDVNTEVESEAFINEENTNEEEINNLNSVLDRVKNNVQMGSAGSSLKAFIVGDDLVKWGSSTKLSLDEIETIVSNYYEKLSKEEKEDFIFEWDAVYTWYKSIISGEIDKEMYESAGVEEVDYNIEGKTSLESVETIQKIIEKNK